MTKSNTMKKIITLSAFAFLFALQMKAQQIPLYSQMYFMRQLYNPALTAYNGSTNLYGFYREQWTGMPGHPVTRGVVGDISLWKDRIGAGFHLYNDNTDIIHRVNAQLYYAQKVRFAKDHQISLGLTLGVMQTRVDFNNAVANDLDDATLLSSGKSGVGFDMNVGLAYQWKKLTVSFSIPQVVNTNARITSQLKETKYSMKRHFIIGASYEVSIKQETWNIEPSVLVKKGAAQPWQVDANIMANYKRIAFLGVGYRLDYGVTMQAAVRIAKAVTIGYSYDYPIMKKVQYSSTQGTHEVILGLNFDRWLKKKPQPAYAKQSDYDSLVNRVNTVTEKLDSTKQAADSLQAQNDEQEVIIKELKDRVESMEVAVAEYKKQVAAHPVTDFPSNVDGSTTAATGDVLRLNSVNFERNSSTLDAGSYTELDKVVTFLKNNKGMHIRILGHTDFKASDEYNDWLSRSRAASVYDYLKSKGIQGNRMVTIGMGKRAPIADNETDEGRAKNRRVEIEIGKKE